MTALACPTVAALPLTLALVSAEPVADTLEAFLASIERRALRIAEIATRHSDDALDLVQDAMLQLARRYADRPPAEWAPLFYRILQNRIRDWQRRETVRRRLFGWSAPDDAEDTPDPIEALPDTGAATGAERAQRGEAMAALERALAALPVRQREAFELRIWEGLDVAATAQAMGCSEGSVKTHLFRALQSLRRALEGVWP